jgi:cell division protein FtsL
MDRSLSHCVKRGFIERRTTLSLLLIFAMVGFIVLISLFQASQMNARSLRIIELKRKKARLEVENAQLLLEIAELMSVSRLEERAEKMGFVFPERIEYLPVYDYPPESALSEGLSPSSPRFLDEITSQFKSWMELSKNVR